MPNRLLRDGICTSDLINVLTAEEEVFFYRMLVVCDDFGHADGRPQILKAQCFPLRDSATPKAIETWLNGLASKGLLRRYESASKPYVALSKWEARVRTNPKFPLPDADDSHWIDSEVPQFERSLSADCGQVLAERGLGKGKGKGKGKGAAEMQSLPDDWKPAERTIERLSREFGLVTEDVEQYVAAFHDACAAKNYRYANFEAAFSNCVRQDWPRLRNGRKNTSPDWQKDVL